MSREINPLPDLISKASDDDMLLGLAMRGVKSTKAMADGSVRVMMRLKPTRPKAPPTRRREKKAIHPDALLKSQPRT